MTKIIQIAVTGHANTMGTQCDWTLIALRSDGRLWAMGSNGHWGEILLPEELEPRPDPIVKSTPPSVVREMFKGD